MSELSTYTCKICGNSDLFQPFHHVYYRNHHRSYYLCDKCYFDKERPPFEDFNKLHSITTINNEPKQLDLWGNPLHV
jgi:hypothetical protein